MIHIAICDDEPVFLEQIKDLVDTVLSSEIFSYAISCFISGEDLCDELNNGTIYQIIFLDISMKGMSGVEVAEKLRSHFKLHKVILIYISSYDKRAKELFCFDTFRFLSKPIDSVLFRKYLLDAIKLLKEQQDNIFKFKDNAFRNCSILLDDIIYFSSEAHRINVITNAQIFQFYGKLKDVYEELELHGFLLIHHSFLVNFKHIRLISYEKVVMSDQTELIISGPKRKEIRQKYSELFKERKKGR